MHEADAESSATVGSSDARAGAVLRDVLGLLEPLSQEDRIRVIATVSTFFQVPSIHHAQARSLSISADPRGPQHALGLPRFSDDRAVGPKEFLLSKAPTADIERVACLAFYLAHHRSTPTFTTADISLLNTEAAQPKFGNPSQAISNAERAALVTHAGKGTKQLSAAGEQFVMALPDRAAATELMKKYSKRRRQGKRTGAASPAPEDD
jgi:hypothetical protein